MCYVLSFVSPVTIFEIACLLLKRIVRRTTPFTFLRLSRCSSIFRAKARSPVVQPICVPLGRHWRLFSQEIQPLDELIVDFDYVKKASDNNSVIIVDVREPDEIKEHGKIPNSINIPLGEVASVLSTMPESEFERTYKKPKPREDDEIIFHCMIGKRSGMAQQNAMNLGYKNVKNYLGSWTDWASKIQ